MSIAALACLCLLAPVALSLVLAARRLRSAVMPSSEAADEPVTIIRPVCGVEPFIRETLLSGFRLAHPAYELLFCVATAQDPVVPLVRQLMRDHPAVPARLLVGDNPISANPKLNNCVKGWHAARHDWIILADSNVSMPPDYIQSLRAAWRQDSGLVCSMPLGTRPEGFWAEVECAFLNTLQARWQYAAECLGFGFAQGKSMLWQRQLLDRHGGIEALGAEIAEDAAATKLVRGAGLRVHLVDFPFEQPIGRRTAAAMWARQTRWARLRRVTFPLLFVPELFSGALPAALLGGWAAAIAGHAAVTGAAMVLLAWYGSETALARSKGWHAPWLMPLACLTRDLLLPLVWLHAWVVDGVTWRDNVMSVRVDQLRSERVG